jgi:hypothetical protein
MLAYISLYLCLLINYKIIHQLDGFLYDLGPWRFYFYLESKSGQWIVDTTKYLVTRKSRYGGLRARKLFSTSPTKNNLCYQVLTP